MVVEVEQDPEAGTLYRMNRSNQAIEELRAADSIWPRWDDRGKD